jgi:serine/threonine protein kinase
VPASTRRILLSAFLSALMTPVALFTVIAIKGGPVPPADVLLSVIMPPFIAAVAALVPAHVYVRLSAQVSRARRLGSYRLVERLGQGGMGEVWRAEHQLLVRPAAVKLVRAELGGPNQLRLLERFEREAQATAALESPHTVQLYDFGVSDDGVFYYVMELLRGIDLESLVQQHGPLPADRAVHLLLQVCDSLADAHRGGLVHRDIKPANIYLAQKAGVCDFVKVLDFGLVTVGASEDVGDELKVSRAGEVHGTPAYMPPEIATGETDIDGRCDLYSLGCVAYWLVTGRLVFDEKTSLKMAIAHATIEPERPSMRGAVVPAELEDIILSCLAKEPSQRPHSAGELAERLRKTGLAATWTRERATAWWREHLPRLSEPEKHVNSLHKPSGALLSPARLKRSTFEPR